MSKRSWEYANGEWTVAQKERFQSNVTSIDRKDPPWRDAVRNAGYHADAVLATVDDTPIGLWIYSSSKSGGYLCAVQVGNAIEWIETPNFPSLMGFFREISGLMQAVTNDAGRSLGYAQGRDAVVSEFGLFPLPDFRVSIETIAENLKRLEPGSEDSKERIESLQEIVASLLGRSTPEEGDRSAPNRRSPRRPPRRPSRR